MNIILDIGGTKTRIGLVNDAFKLLETSFMLTEKKYDNGIKNIFSYIKDKDIRVTNVCVGIAGVFNNEKLYSSPNLQGWIDKPIKKDLEENFPGKVFFENDAALAGLGETVYGAGKGYGIVSYITIGTGVGGARIVDKKIDAKAYGFEPGHQIMNVGLEGRPGSGKRSANNLKSFESLVSGRSIQNIYGNLSEKIEDKKTWKKIINNIAVGISNMVYFWSPDVVILGGGVTRSDFFDIALLEKEFERILKKTYPEVPKIKKTALGDFSGIWGGIDYIKHAV